MRHLFCEGPTPHRRYPCPLQLEFRFSASAFSASSRSPRPPTPVSAARAALLAEGIPAAARASAMLSRPRASARRAEAAPSVATRPRLRPPFPSVGAAMAVVAARRHRLRLPRPRRAVATRGRATNLRRRLRPLRRAVPGICRPTPRVPPELAATTPRATNPILRASCLLAGRARATPAPGRILAAWPPAVSPRPGARNRIAKTMDARPRTRAAVESGNRPRPPLSSTFPTQDDLAA